MLNRPAITDQIIEQVNTFITQHPDMSRTRISQHLCELWDWKNPNGQLKDISCRDMLRILDRDGLITLPPANIPYHLNASRDTKHLPHDTTPISGELNQFQPIHISPVEDETSLVFFKSWIDQHHYLAYGRTVGENMKYLVRSRDGWPLACLLFGSAAWSCRDRDAYIGWNRPQRRDGLPFVTNNTRFLIPDWIHIPHLASHVLSQIARRISTDWQRKYGHPIFLLETFVECDRFRGTCYQAANWIRVGKTAGRGRDDRNGRYELPIKEIYLYPTVRDFRKAMRLCR